MRKNQTNLPDADDDAQYIEYDADESSAAMDDTSAAEAAFSDRTKRIMRALADFKEMVMCRSHVICYVIPALLIVTLVALCIVFRDEINADTIAAIVPDNYAMAAVFMLMLFGIKGLSVVIPSVILYAAGGMIFPRATALLVNIFGTVIMTSIPFWIGRKGGSRYVEKMVSRHPRMDLLKERQQENSLFFAFVIRAIGIFPCDLVSAFLGATAIPYDKYIVGTTLGLLPTVTLFTIMGMSVHDITSPAFIISVCLECAITISSYIFYRYLHKKKQTDL